MSGAVDLTGKGGSLIQGDAPDFLAPPRVTVLGVGNVLLTDEGFGVRVAEFLDAAYEFPDDVQVLDGGVLGMELLRFVTGTEKLLILDALKEGGADEKCRRLAGDEVKAHFREKLSAHEIGVQDVLTFLEVTGKPVGEVVVIGAEPKSLEAGLTLSPEMEPRVAEAAKMAAEELSRWDVKLKRKDEIK
ncbi:MAG: HyaD/HybD family hydrogenase maturation endopeptidase [Schwartzia sp.]|nr:HyaD/HybD family hydrogenase maturation endopeptidase [Schwartzia sp. (in: firmicutes)]